MNSNRQNGNDRNHDQQAEDLLNVHMVDRLVSVRVSQVRAASSTSRIDDRLLAANGTPAQRVSRGVVGAIWDLGGFGSSSFCVLWLVLPCSSGSSNHFHRGPLSLSFFTMVDGDFKKCSARQGTRPVRSPPPTYQASIEVVWFIRTHTGTLGGYCDAPRHPGCVPTCDPRHEPVKCSAEHV